MNEWSKVCAKIKLYVSIMLARMLATMANKATKKSLLNHLWYSVKRVSIRLLKTSNGILKFLRFDWLTRNDILAHIPLTTNMVAHTRQ